MKSELFVEGTAQYLWWYCPGCETNHRVPVSGHPAAWTWNGDTEKPTLTPSVKVQWHKTANGGTTRVQDSNGNDVMHICHVFITDGQIHFLGDCTHHLAGQVVPLEEMT